MACEAAEGLLAVHAAGLMHRDIKGSNVMLTADNHVSIGDFDCVTDEVTSDIYAGSLGYMAPEVMMGDTYDKRCDVYSFAGLLYEITHSTIPFGKELPFNGPDENFEENLTGLVCTGTCPACDPNRCPPAMIGLMEKCWEMLPEDRPTFKDIVRELKAMEDDFA
jgi:serine/threonine protein kinase